MIRAKYFNNSYMLFVYNALMNDRRPFACKFDSGAVATMIPLKLMAGSDNTCNAEDLFSRLLKMHKTPVTFTAATGHTMTGIKCHAKDIIISGVEIPDFYYYITDSNRSVALLGDDFISCCSFKHVPGDDILIDDINLEMYKRNNQGNYVNSKDILEILSSSFDQNHSSGTPNKLEF